jgi:hypothetical protein
MSTLMKSMNRVCISILVFGICASLMGQGAEFLIITHDDFA